MSRQSVQFFDHTGSAANLGAEVNGGHIYGPWQLQADA
jgi:hypothetical protein